MTTAAEDQLGVALAVGYAEGAVELVTALAGTFDALARLLPEQAAQASWAAAVLRQLAPTVAVIVGAPQGTPDAADPGEYRGPGCDPGCGC